MPGVLKNAVSYHDRRLTFRVCPWRRDTTRWSPTTGRSRVATVWRVTTSVLI